MDCSSTCGSVLYLCPWKDSVFVQLPGGGAFSLFCGV
jgi:hypothetical protein